MKKKRFTVEQIVGVLKQAQVGVPVAEVNPEGWDQRADVLPMEGEVRGPGGGRGSEDGAVARGEHAPEAACG